VGNLGGEQGETACTSFWDYMTLNPFYIRGKANLSKIFSERKNCNQKKGDINSGRLGSRSINKWGMVFGKTFPPKGKIGWRGGRKKVLQPQRKRRVERLQA